MTCEVPLIAGLPGPLRWRGRGLWRLLWPSLFTKTYLAGYNKQNKIWDNKNVSVFMKAQTISQEKKSFRANWKHLTSSSLLWKKKKKSPTIQLSLWNSHPSKNDWKEGRKRGKAKKKREGERDQRLVQSPECEQHLIILVTCLSSLEIHPFIFSHIIKQM